MSQIDIKKQLSNYLWVEKFRPTTLDSSDNDKIEIILPKTYKDFFRSLIKDGQIPNLILHSNSPGSGKTSIAKAICYDIDAVYKYINVSEKGGIDTLRNEITKFASMKAFNGKPKIVIMDEFDGASPNLQNGLRAAIEEFKNSCRFIFTCNFITKIIDPIKSRCMMFNFDLTEPKIKKELRPLLIDRICGILSFEEVEYSKPTVEKIVDTFFPDIRKMISLCQKYSKINKCIDENIFSYDNVDDEFYTFIFEKKLGKARKYLIGKNYNYSELYRELFDNLLPKIQADKQGKILLIIAEYMHRHSTVIDQEINASACLFEIIANL
jgi:DNA polymerase III delta prime subunit